MASKCTNGATWNSNAASALRVAFLTMMPDASSAPDRINASAAREA